MNKCIVLCGGNSERFGENKLLFRLEDKTVVEKTVGTVLSSNVFDEVIVVIRKDDDDIKKALSGFDVRFIVGGNNRSMSSYNGLLACGDCDVVAIHDGARCFVEKDLIKKCVDSAKNFGSGVAAVSMTDTVREKDGEYFGETLERSSLLRVQTPQAFSYKEILFAYQKAFEKYGENMPYTDDSEIYSEFIGKCRIVEGNESNKKITYKEDIEDIPLYGVGYDIHKIERGNGIVLCGVNIPCDKRLIAHSDGDVPIHSLMDAMLAAMGKKDIGHYFPDTDDNYKDISSFVLLDKVLEIAKSEGKSIQSATMAIICERPKLSSYIDKMREKVSKALDVSIEKVGISVTTNEKVGEIGKGEAIACVCSVVLR